MFVKTVAPLFLREKLIESMQRLKKIYEQSERNAENATIFLDFVKLLGLCIKSMVIAYLIGLIAYWFTPALLYYFDSTKLVPMTPMCLPWTTLNTTDGYVLNSIHHAFVAIFAIGGYLFFDTFFLLQIMHTTLLANILRKKIRSVRRVLADGATDLKLKVHVRNIVQLHIEMLGCGKFMFANENQFAEKQGGDCERG